MGTTPEGAQTQEQAEEQAAEEAQVEEDRTREEAQAALTAAFPGVEVAVPGTALDQIRENFATVKVVRMKSSTSDGSHPVADDVILSPSGVYAKSWLSGTFAETIVVNKGKVGFLRAPAKFWLTNGMSRDSAKRAGQRWVQTQAVANPDQVLAKVRERLVNEFTNEWGAGIGEVELTEFRNTPAVRVDTADGYVVAAGSPLLPVKYVFERDGKTSQMMFAYAGVKPVNAPKNPISLDAVVAQ